MISIKIFAKTCAALLYGKGEGVWVILSLVCACGPDPKLGEGQANLKGLSAGC